MKESLMDISRYAKYIGHDPHLNEAIVKRMRPANRRISILLEDVDFMQTSSFDPHLSNARHINSIGFLAKFLKEHDDSRIYMSEAEKATIPTKDFVAHFT